MNTKLLQNEIIRRKKLINLSKQEKTISKHQRVIQSLSKELFLIRYSNIKF
jgi:hypothetical protein